MEDFDLARYIYWEYSLAVLLVTEMIRALTKNIQLRFIQIISVEQPKWLSLFTAILLAVLDWIIMSNGNKFHLWQFTISFGLAVLGYDYGWKIVKDKFITPLMDAVKIKLSK